jgi:hypothetical protein
MSMYGVLAMFPPLELKKGSLNSKSISTNTQYVTLNWNSWMRFISESSGKTARTY